MRSKFVLYMVMIFWLLLMVSSALGGEKPEDLYKTYCWQCHGMDGKGNGVNVRDMSVQPRDHTDPKAMSTRSDDELFKAIKEGGLAINKSVLMPPWGDTLSDDEIRSLVSYLRKLCNCSFKSGT